MKAYNKNLVKQVTKALEALERTKDRRYSRDYYSLAFKREVIMHAVAHTAEYTSSVYSVPSKSIRQWLRSVGLEQAINAYHWHY
jgi:hypothetical protein